ncbi:hypothetical protein DICPUDRAFT_50320 [Dictyostelium purpureum]|uniref:enoyl-[acyl-carrier-protein] reductase n=1 Tax=Dictyostelium purpureum TaxID=5786 RepID=F0ZXZ0_DICPU|nr:uncharacterized protein DICPUDRAFT_50320 [Dictyostelium purpureum]EGC31196.1 hypothetical protein DICPUDRAFT_50320 [Dictyostelium purpureum]|eukprot:XP_003292285.1 hypothetical protein DICPUDRAFT_50320 [Dictyostelium purpureum]
MLNTRLLTRFVRQYTTSRAVKITQNGDPTSVLKIEEESIPAVKGSDILVEMLHAPINPADINLIKGTYGTSVPVSSVAGMEGVGIVKNVGNQVSGFKENDIVIPSLNSHFGSWRTQGLFKEKDLIKAPADIPAEYLATVSINPTTAYILLKDFVNLQEGDVIIQNAANSMVGLSVVQIAKSRGIKTINVIRNGPDFEDNVNRIKKLGGDIVVSDKYIRTPAFQRLIADLPRPKLALNAVGGASATELVRILGDNGTIVTYGGMSREPVVIPTSHLVFRNIKSQGFWLNRWISENSLADRTKIINNIFDLYRKQNFKLMIEKHKFSDFEAALEKSQQGGNGRKIVLDLQL